MAESESRLATKCPYRWGHNPIGADLGGAIAEFLDDVVPRAVFGEGGMRPPARAYRGPGACCRGRRGWCPSRASEHGTEPGQGHQKLPRAGPACTTAALIWHGLQGTAIARPMWAAACPLVFMPLVPSDAHLAHGCLTSWPKFLIFPRLSSGCSPPS